MAVLDAEQVALLPGYAVDLGLSDPGQVAAQWVYKLRRTLGLSRESLAQALGNINLRTIQYWEYGKATPRFEYCQQLNQLELRKVGSGDFPFAESMLRAHFRVMPPQTRRAALTKMIEEFQALLEEADAENVVGPVASA